MKLSLDALTGVVFLLILSPSTFAENMIIHAGTFLAEPNMVLKSRQSIIVVDRCVPNIHDRFTGIDPGHFDSLAVDLFDRLVMPGFTEFQVHLAGQADAGKRIKTETQSDTVTETGTSSMQTLVRL